MSKTIKIRCQESRFDKLLYAFAEEFGDSLINSTYDMSYGLAEFEFDYLINTPKIKEVIKGI